MEDQTKANFEHALKWGLILGMTDIIIYLLAYIIDKSVMASMTLGLAMWVINIILLIIPVTIKRKELGGLISFNDAFVICFVVFIGGALLQTIFNYILYNLIDPGLTEFIKQKTIETTTALMEKLGTPQESIDKAIDDIQSKDFSQTPARISAQFLFMLVYGGIISLIIGAIFKRTPKITDIE